MLLFSTFVFVDSFAQAMPLVYNVENTGANCPIPYMLTLSQLPYIQALPDPFERADGTGRMTNFSDWETRRAEIGAQIQNYEIGERPVRLETITANYSGGVLTVKVTVNGKTLTLSSQVILPAGTGPFPVVIGMDYPYGSIPSDIFSSRNIAEVTFNSSQVTTDDSPTNADPYHRLYPYLNVTNTGQYSAWAWGVSRLIDGLQLVQNVLPIDLKHIAVTGCSYAGKMALFAGAFDERVALTIAQESGGGGATSWRYSHSEPAGSVEDIDNTDYNWFMNSMIQFSGNNVSYLPEDHHELMAMCAPRALYVTANPGWIWLSNPSCYVCSEACQPVYNALGIADRFGFSLVGNHFHCAFPDSETPEIEAFVDKFLLGNDTVNTNIADTYYNIDLSPWITWTTPTLSNDTTLFTTLVSPSNSQKDLDTTSVTFRWNTVEGAEKYFIQLSLDPTFKSIEKRDSTITDTAKTFSGFLQGKTYYWRVEVKSSAGLGPWSNVWNFITYVPLPAMPQLVGATPEPGQPGSVTFEWNKVQYADQYLIQLAHSQSFTALFYKDSTASDTFKTVSGFSEGQKYYWRVQAKNVEGSSAWSDSNFTLTDIKIVKGEIPTEYSISQNYPNPFNPSTKIEIALPQRALTKITIYDVLGREIQTLINNELEAGYYETNIDASRFPSGVYFYRIQSGNFLQTKKMILMK